MITEDQAKELVSALHKLKAIRDLLGKLQSAPPQDLDLELSYGSALKFRIYAGAPSHDLYGRMSGAELYLNDRVIAHEAQIVLKTNFANALIHAGENLRDRIAALDGDPGAPLLPMGGTTKTGEV
jgi:hypothetical protein